MKKPSFPIITLFCAADAGLCAILVFSLAGYAPNPVTSSAPAAEPATMTEVLDSKLKALRVFREPGDDFPQILWGNL